MVYFAIMAAQYPSYQLTEDEGTSLEKNNLNIILVFSKSKTLLYSIEIMFNYIIHIVAS